VRQPLFGYIILGDSYDSANVVAACMRRLTGQVHPTPSPANLVRASPLFPRGKHAEFGIVVEFDDAAALRRQVVRRLTDKLAAIPSNCVIPEFEELRS
jgi:hypothetical protein